MTCRADQVPLPGSIRISIIIISPLVAGEGVRVLVREERPRQGTTLSLQTLQVVVEQIFHLNDAVGGDDAPGRQQSQSRRIVDKILLLLPPAHMLREIESIALHLLLEFFMLEPLLLMLETFLLELLKLMLKHPLMHRVVVLVLLGVTLGPLLLNLLLRLKRR